MKYTQIKNTDLKASRLVLGSAEFGSTLSVEASFELMDAFYKAGGNMIDTASVYANWLDVERSISEKTIGKWLEKTGLRKNMIISTKGGHFDLKTKESRVTVKDIKDDFEKSLENLKTDYIDIYWLHKDDENKSPEEIITLFNEAVDTSKVKYFGVSNWPYDRIKAANDYAKKNGLVPFIASQLRYSIAKINYDTDGIFVMDESEYKKYEKDDLNVFGFSSQARGFFAIMDKTGESGLTPAHMKELWNDYNLGVLDKLKNMSKEMGVSVPALVVGALVSDKKVPTFAQIGPRNLSELSASLEAADIDLTAEQRDKLLKA